MEITYLGHSCFKISGKKINILIDPFDPTVLVGKKISKQDADVVTVSHGHSDHNNLSVMKNEDYLVLDSAGEYEIRESEFVGVEAFHDDKNGEERGKVTMFTMEVDGIKIAHLGDLGVELKSAQIEKLDGVDILMVPVGGIKVIDAETAVKVIGQIDPKIVLPMHFGPTVNTPFAPVENFFKVMAVTPEPQDKLKVTVKDLPLELQVVNLKFN
jgi:L-ascorbate metabolism protein UlaG (beta-lactamase superfamily)